MHLRYIGGIGTEIDAAITIAITGGACRGRGGLACGRIAIDAPERRGVGHIAGDGEVFVAERGVGGGITLEFSVGST